MAYFPFFIDIKDKKCIIIGGGQVAYRKVEALLEFDAEIVVIAPTICDELLLLKDHIHIKQRGYQEADLDEAFYVIAATNDCFLNQNITSACRERKLLVNAVDDLKNCDFLFPSYVKKGAITIGVTTSGKSPVMARYIRRRICEKIPGYFEELVDNLGGYREYVKNTFKEEKKRSAVFSELAKLGIDNNGRVTQEDVDRAIQKQIEKDA